MYKGNPYINPSNPSNPSHPAKIAGILWLAVRRYKPQNYIETFHNRSKGLI